MLYVLDGIAILGEYRERFDDRFAKLSAEQDPAARRRLIEDMVAFANAYDEQVDQVAFVLEDGLRV